MSSWMSSSGQWKPCSSAVVYKYKMTPETPKSSMIAQRVYIVLLRCNLCTAVCIMIDRLQKWVKCNFPSPLIGIHGQPHWRLGVSGFIWFESTYKVKFPKYGNCSVPCISSYRPIKYGITLWKTIYSQLRTICEVHHKVWEWFTQ